MVNKPDLTSLPPTDRQCTAMKVGSGRRCKQYAIRGGSVCVKHGGKAPQVWEAAQRRLFRAQLRKDMTQLTHDLELNAEQMGPIQVLLDAVYRSHAQVQIMGAFVADLAPGDYTVTYARTGEDRPNPYLLMYERALAQAATASKLAIDAGVAEAIVQIEQDKAKLLASVINAVLADPELGLTAAQRAKAPPVLGRHLRALAPAS
jgi:hypothetical protein